MTAEQKARLEALWDARGRKRPDGSPLIDDDTHREFIEKLWGDERRYVGGISLGEKDDLRLTEFHRHYLGGGAG